MSPRKKELKPGLPINHMAAFITRFNAGPSGRKLVQASEAMADWRYIDWINPLTSLPCLSLEWLFGARGLLAGRIAQLKGKFGVGKSSLMWLVYASAQRLVDGAFCFHSETEGALPPPDYIASYGCDPQLLAINQPKSLEDCFETIDEALASIRGGLGGSKNPETGRQMKTKYDDPMDPKCVRPIVVGIDSFSSLGVESKVQEDILDMRKSASLGEHARKLSEYMRDRCDRFRSAQALMLLATQEKVKINTGMPSYMAGDNKTTLAESPIGFHSTYSVEITSHKYIVEGNDIGDRISLFTTKNKISDKHKSLDLYLIRNKGFDLIKADTDFLVKHPASPFGDTIQRTAHGIKCPLSDKLFKSDEEFLRTLYADKDMVMAFREKMRIRGFGFDFETKYMPNLDEEEDDGVDRTDAKVPDGQPAGNSAGGGSGS